MAIQIDGAGTITGISSGGLNDNIITENELVDGSVSLDKLTAAAQPIGFGQTWQNVTASRSQNVTYTNNTGRPIMVHLNGVGSTDSNAVRLVVNGVTMRFRHSVSQGAGQVIVPNGATYIGHMPNGLYEWCELR